MWLNIPLVVLLVFVNNYDTGLLIAFTIVNAVLALFEFFQFSSMDLFNYLGGTNKLHFLIGLRLALLGLLFIPNFQPYSCTIYFCLTVCILVEDGSTQVPLQSTVPGGN